MEFYNPKEYVHIRICLKSGVWITVDFLKSWAVHPDRVELVPADGYPARWPRVPYVERSEVAAVVETERQGL